MFKAEVIGNLGRDASVRQINGKEYVCFDLAHGERQNGEKRTVWKSTLWPGNGGNLLQYLHKGTTVFVRGGLFSEALQRQHGVPCRDEVRSPGILQVVGGRKMSPTVKNTCFQCNWMMRDPVTNFPICISKPLADGDFQRVYQRQVCCESFKSIISKENRK